MTGWFNVSDCICKRGRDWCAGLDGDPDTRDTFFTLLSVLQLLHFDLLVPSQADNWAQEGDFWRQHRPVIEQETMASIEVPFMELGSLGASTRTSQEAHGRAEMLCRRSIRELIIENHGTPFACVTPHRSYADRAHGICPPNTAVPPLPSTLTTFPGEEVIRRQVSISQQWSWKGSEHVASEVCIFI